LWYSPFTKFYGADLVNFGLHFGADGCFQCSFNPVHPLASFQFKSHLWIALMPGKRRQSQGQILYQASTGDTDKYEYDVCQWSPQGTYLLVLKRVYVNAAPRKIVIHNSDPRGGVYVIRAQVYRVEENRGRLSFKELNGVSSILHDAVGHHQLTGNCLIFLLFSKINQNFYFNFTSKKYIFFLKTENLWLDDSSFLWTTSLGLPLFRCFISPAKKGVPAFIEKKILLNKSGHCRLASAPTGCEENVSYSGSN
jgi:hypothetical protein